MSSLYTRSPLRRLSIAGKTPSSIYVPDATANPPNHQNNQRVNAPPSESHAGYSTPTANHAKRKQIAQFVRRFSRPAAAVVACVGRQTGKRTITSATQLVLNRMLSSAGRPKIAQRRWWSRRLLSPFLKCPRRYNTARCKNRPESRNLFFPCLPCLGGCSS